MIRPARHSQGFSVAELTVSVFLLGFLLMLTIGAFVPGLKVTKQAEESIAAQREVVLAFERLMAEMSLMDRLGATPGQGCLSFLSHQEYRGSNPELDIADVQLYSCSTPSTIWKKFVVLRLREGRIWRREFPYDGQTVLARVKPDRLIGVADLANRQEKVFTREVEEFDASLVGQSRVRLRIRSVFRSGRRPESCDMQFEIVMRGTNG